MAGFVFLNPHYLEKGDKHGKTQNHPLRAFTPSEEQELHRVAHATSERLDAVKRARALLCVQAGQSFTQAAQEAGYKSGDSISQLVERFNERGLAALLLAPGRGRKPIYTNDQRARIIAEVQRQHPQTVQQVIDSLEQTVDGWNQNPIPFV